MSGGSGHPKGPHDIHSGCTSSGSNNVSCWLYRPCPSSPLFLFPSKLIGTFSPSLGFVLSAPAVTLYKDTFLQTPYCYLPENCHNETQTSMTVSGSRVKSTLQGQRPAAHAPHAPIRHWGWEAEVRSRVLEGRAPGEAERQARVLRRLLGPGLIPSPRERLLSAPSGSYLNLFPVILVKSSHSASVAGHPEP